MAQQAVVDSMVASAWLANRQVERQVRWLRVLAQGRKLLESWTSEQTARSCSPVDPMEIVLLEGGPYHCRGHLSTYLDRLRATGRSSWADILEQRHPTEL